MELRRRLRRKEESSKAISDVPEDVQPDKAPPSIVKSIVDFDMTSISSLSLGLTNEFSSKRSSFNEETNPLQRARINTLESMRKKGSLQRRSSMKPRTQTLSPLVTSDSRAARAITSPQNLESIVKRVGYCSCVVMYLNASFTHFETTRCSLQDYQVSSSIRRTQTIGTMDPSNLEFPVTTRQSLQFYIPCLP